MKTAFIFAGGGGLGAINAAYFAAGPQTHLINGGVANHTPVSTAIRLGASRLIVLPTGFTCAPAMPPTGALIIALYALKLVIARQLAQDLGNHQGQAKVLLLQPLCPQRSHSLNFQAAGDLFDQGYAMTGKWLDQGGLKQELSLAGMMPHHH